MHAINKDCCAMDPKSSSCTLPSGAKDLPGTPPCNAAMDRAIEERYGKVGDTFAGMKNPSASSDRFSGPGQS